MNTSDLNREEKQKLWMSNSRFFFEVTLFSNLGILVQRLSLLIAHELGSEIATQNTLTKSRDAKLRTTWRKSGKAIMCFLSLMILLWGILVLAASDSYGAAPSTEDADLVISEKASPPIRFAAAAIKRILEEKMRMKVHLAPKEPPVGLHIFLGQRGDGTLAENKPTIAMPPEAAESFALSMPSRDTIVVTGSDATGAMYGALDLVEQISSAKGGDLISQLKPTRKSPFLAFRGVNMFLTTQDIDDPEGAFWSDPYWTCAAQIFHPTLINRAHEWGLLPERSEARDICQRSWSLRKRP